MKSPKLALAFAFLASTAVLAAEAPPGMAGMKSKGLDSAWARPDADLRPYARVMLDPAEVSFAKGWAEGVNDSRPGLANDVTARDAEATVAATRAAFDAALASAVRAGGYEIVSDPGPGVLRLSPALVKLRVMAPDARDPAMTSFARETGEATLVIEARDSVTGTVLWRAQDERETRRPYKLQPTSSVVTLADADALFRSWSESSVRSLGELKARGAAAPAGQTL